MKTKIKSFIKKILQFRIRKYVAEGAVYPTGYSVAYIDWPTTMKVCYPIPLNFIVKWIRNAIGWIRHKSWGQTERDKHEMRITSTAFHRGYEAGRIHKFLSTPLETKYNEGYEAGKNDYMKLMERRSLSEYLKENYSGTIKTEQHPFPKNTTA